MNNKLKLVFAIQAMLSCGLAQANLSAAQVQFNQTRFLLTESSRSQSLELTNTGRAGAQCQLSFIHYNQMNGTGMLEVDKSKAIAPASHLLRYSPKRVTIPKDQSQTARLIFRRRPNLQEGDYLSYIRMRCDQDALLGNKNALSATVNFNIPVHVRVGDPKGELTFDNVKLDRKRNVVNFKLSRTGKRSWVGDINVIDSKGSVVGRLNGLAVYPSAEYITRQVSLTKSYVGKLKLQFKEEREFGNAVKIAAINI